MWNDRFAPTNGPIVLVASDGDGVRRRLLYNFTSSVTSEKFAEFDLLDATTSEHGVVQCFDLKHNLKRLRTRDISKRGVKISASALPLNCDSFPQLFRWYDCKPNDTYRTLLNPDDRYVSLSSRRINGLLGSLPSSLRSCAIASRKRIAQPHRRR